MARRRLPTKQESALCSGEFTVGHGKLYVGRLWSLCVLKLTCFQFPIGMGTGAVFVCLSDVEQTPGHPLTIIGTVFFYLNLFLFCLNLSTLLLQLICEYKFFIQNLLRQVENLRIVQCIRNMHESLSLILPAIYLFLLW